MTCKQSRVRVLVCVSTLLVLAPIGWHEEGSATCPPTGAKLEEHRPAPHTCSVWAASGRLLYGDGARHAALHVDMVAGMRQSSRCVTGASLSRRDAGAEHCTADFQARRTARDRVKLATWTLQTLGNSPRSEFYSELTGTCTSTPLPPGLVLAWPPEALGLLVSERGYSPADCLQTRRDTAQEDKACS
ncbi:hypothetical protein DFH06DRAFT_1125297 [Mycena polygramma]|nr:hypothetical protein DFH06DRAFT_1125297 [Mycena polygramma]